MVVAISGAILAVFPFGPAQQIDIHDPTVPLPRLSPYRSDFVPDVGKFPRAQDFMLGPEISAPENLEVLVGEFGKGLYAIQQHHHTARIIGKSFGQLASRCQQYAFADLVQRDPVPRGQNLNAADARDHLEFQRQTFDAHPFDDPQRAVVDRRIAPYQESADVIRSHLALEHRAVNIGAPAVPFLYTVKLVAGSRPL